MQMVWRVGAIALVGALCLGLVSCASSGAYKRGRQAWIKGEWDTAVVEFRQALQEHPDRTDYKGALQQAMSTASPWGMPRSSICRFRSRAASMTA